MQIWRSHFRVPNKVVHTILGWEYIETPQVIYIGETGLVWRLCRIGEEVLTGIPSTASTGYKSFPGQMQPEMMLSMDSSFSSERGDASALLPCPATLTQHAGLFSTTMSFRYNPSSVCVFIFFFTAVSLCGDIARFIALLLRAFLGELPWCSGVLMSWMVSGDRAMEPSEPKPVVSTVTGTTTHSPLSTNSLHDALLSHDAGDSLSHIGDISEPQPELTEP